MAQQEQVRIVSADRFEGFVLVGFSDGKYGRYSAELLYGMLAHYGKTVEQEVANDFDEPEPAT